MTFDEEGKAKPLSLNKSDWDYLRVDYSIKYLNLNFKGLKEARKILWKKCFELILEIEKILQEVQATPSIAKKQSIKEKMKELKSMVKDDSEFSATAKTCLVSSGLVWAIRLAA